MKKSLFILMFALLSSYIAVCQYEPGTRASAKVELNENILVNGLTQLYSVTGNYILSADGAGSLNSSFSIDVNKPSLGASVHKAYLFGASRGFQNYSIPNGCITLNGTGINWDMTISSGISSYNHYAEVTGLIASLINPLVPGIISIPVTECSTSLIDGISLLVIFSDVTTTEKTILIMFGALSTTGDDFSITLSEPIDPNAPGALLNMGLGISFGFQGNEQYSLIDVNGQRLTTSAGGADDSQGDIGNGSLITVGGLGDLNSNPPDPFALPVDNFSDDELYSLLPLITNTTTSVLVNTVNPSNDDNVFLSYFEISGAAIIGEGILLSQTSNTGFIGTDHTVKAAVFNDLGQPVPNRLVTFNVISGPNAGANFAVNTNANGEAFFTYNGSGGIGTDQIQACFLNNQNQTLCSNILSFEWVTQGGCVNPTYGGEIGFAQSHCGGLDPDPFVSIAPPSGFTGNLEFKWQYSTDMVNFLDIPFSNVEAYDAGFTDVTTWFKRLARVDCKPDWTGAAESNVVEITILPGILPGPAGEITGQAVVCNYSQAIYCVPYITDATSYIWEYSGTGVIFVEMAKCQSCIILQFTGEATSGILTVRGHNDCGDGLVSPDYPIVVELYPADAGPIAGPIKVNQGQTGVPYSVPVIAYATSYIWSYDGTGVTINGSGNSVTLDFDVNATSGWLTVAGNNNCGNGLYTFLPITVDPNTPIYGPAIVAPGQSNVPYFVNKTPNVSNYLWSYTGSGATINSKSNIISIDFSKNASSGDLIVTGMINGGEAFESVLPVKVESGFSNNNGKSSGTISENETIEVFPNPANEVINVSSASGLKRIVVTNSTGQIVYNEEISGNNSQVNVSDFIPGIYFIKIETQYNTVVKKVSVR